MRSTASIVTYLTATDELCRALDSLKGGVDEVYVVDNSRQSEIERICRDKDVEYIGSKNVGYGAGHNQALRRAMASGSDIHLVMNSDITITSESIRQAIEIMSREPRTALLHPRLLNADGSEQYTVRLLPAPLDLIARRFMPRRLFRRRLDCYELKDKDRCVARKGAYFQGSFMLFRLSALRETGLFDERFFMYPEDIDISRRIASSGNWDAVYHPEIQAVHGYRAASRRSIKLLVIHIVNMIRYFNKWGWLTDNERQRLNRQILSSP